MKRVSLTEQEQINDHITSPKSKHPLVPRVPDSFENCTVIFEDGKEVELPLLHAKEGPVCIDGRQLYEKTGLFSYDPGFTSTASCVSAITFIDGE